MASHFGISLVCFASVFLVMRVLWETTPITSAATRAVPSGFRTLAWATLLWAVVVAYIGAYMRHSGAELACYTWPLCNGSLLPDFSSPGVAVAWTHRLAALIALALVAWLEIWSRRFKKARPDLYRISLWASAFIIAQAAAGAFVIFSRLSLASTLSHAALMALLFAALADAARRTLPQRRAEQESPIPASAGVPAPAQ
jgi:cytochrome c oxidase assembly protein subunit 15